MRHDDRIPIRGRNPLRAPARALLALTLAAAASAALPALAQSGDAADGERHEGFRIERDPDVPSLPFADNPDPLLCGIPQPVAASDSGGSVTGWFEGERIMDPVLLYDSHLRRSVVGSVPSGHPVTLQLFQANPELDYFRVRAVVDGASVQGWVPAPFVVRGEAGN